MELVSADEPVNFLVHIKPLFRPLDRQSMQKDFDPWSRDDVAKHANAILARLEAGSMPCDGASPPDQVDAFKRWVAAGRPE